MQFNDDEDTSVDLGPADQTSGTQTVGFSSRRGAANPYTEQLQGLLTKYLKDSEKTATDKQALLDQARERVMARSAGPNQAETAFRIAAALGKPTRTGSFGESLSNVAETTSDVLAQRRKASQELEDLNLKYQLAASDAKGEGQKVQIGALSTLARSVPKDRLTEVERLQETLDDPKSSESAKATAKARIGFLTTRSTASQTSEIEKLQKIIDDAASTPGAKANAKARIRKLTYIAPEAKATRDEGKPQSPAGKLASDEGLVPGTPEYQARVKALAGEGKGRNLSAQEQKELFEAEDIVSASKGVLLTLSKAKELSPKAYEGFGAGARRTVARNIPGVKQSEGVTASTELETLIGENALSQLKAIFGGAPTEGERKILLDLQGSLSMSDKERQAIYGRAMEAAARRLKSNQEKMDRIRKGSYSSRVEPEEKAAGGPVGYADGGPVKMADGGYTSEQIRDYLSSNPGMTDNEIARAMDQFGVNTSQMAQATGLNLPDIQARYDSASQPISDQQVQTWLGERSNLSDQDIAFAMNQYGVDPTQMSRATGLDLNTVQSRYNTAAPKYTNADVNNWLLTNPGATDQQIAAAMNKFGVGTLQMSATTGLPWQDVSKRYTAAGGAQSQPTITPTKTTTAQATPTSQSSELTEMQRKYLGGPEGITTYGQYGSKGPQGEHKFFDRQLVKKARGGPVKMAAGGQVSLANMGRAVGQGLGLGFGDEAIARVRSKMEGRPYEDVVREEREAYQKFQEKNPFVALGTELVSGAIPTIGLAMVPGAGTAGAVAGGSRMAAAANKFRQAMPQFMKGSMGKAAAAGATTGAVAGAGSETEGNRGEGALTGGATGAVLGPAVAKTLQVGGQGVSAVKNALRPSPNAVEQRATNKVLEAMGRDEMGVDDIRARMRADQKLGVNSTMMDASPSMSSLGEAVVTRPGPGRKILGQGLNERLEGGRESVGTRSLQSIGKGVDYTAQEDSLMGTLRANANNLYDAAYAHGAVDDPRIMKVLEDDTFKKAFAEAKAIANKEARAAELRGEDPSKYKLKDLYELDPADNTFKFTGTQLPDVRTLDYVKRGIDALIDKGYRGEGMSKAEANALKDLKKAYVSAIDDNVPEYAAARARYAGDIEVLDALRLGRTDYMSPKTLPAEAKKIVSNMSDAERDALRAGVAQSLLTKIMEAPQQINAAQRVIGAPATRKRLEALFEDPNEYKVFEAALKRESELFRNAQDIVRGSRTANKTEAMADLKSGNGIFDIAGEAVDVAAGSPGSVIGRVLKYLQARTTLDEKTAGEIATMLKSGTPQEVNATLKRLESSSTKFLQDKNASARRMKTVSGTVGAAAPTTSLPPPESESLGTEDEDDEAKLQRLLEKYSTKE